MLTRLDGLTSYGTWQGIPIRYGSEPTTSTSTFIPIAATAVSASTGVSPRETSYSLYGHIVPLTVFGIGRIGCEIISGPWIENGLASFIVSAGVPADPSGTRTLREIAFDSEVVWDNVNGFRTEAFTYRFYGGTFTQLADTLESSHFGADAVAYRPQILLAISNLPLANTKFNAIPYVALVIADASGDDVNLGEAFERLAASPWVELDAFETSGITDGLVSGGLIIAQDYEFLQLIQEFGRFYPKWDILQTDMLRVVDRGATVTADITLNTERLMDKIIVTRQGPDSVRKDLELSTIDPDADYTIVPSLAKFPRDPVVVSTSVGRDSAYLPMIMDASTRISIVTYAKYHEEVARKSISGTAMALGLEIEPGALVAIRDLGDDFNNETFKIVETLHGANYVVEFTAESILVCSYSLPLPDDSFNYTVLLAAFDGSDGSTTGSGMVDDSPAQQADAICNGTAVIDTAQFKFGTSSMRFGDGAADYLHYAPTDDWNFRDGTFTVECWIRPDDTGAGTRFFIGKWGLDAFRCWALYQSGTAIGFARSDDGYNSYFEAEGGVLVANTWAAVCVDFDGIKTRVYLNGVMVASTSTIRDISEEDFRGLTIGNAEFALFADGFVGWIDEVRITKGLARYASDGGYTVSTTAFPRE